LELPFEIVTSLIFAIFGDLVVGLPRTPKAFFTVAYCCFCIVSSGESLGILFNTFFDHTGFAVSITSIVLCIAQMMCGAMSINMPSFLQSFNYLNPLKYALEILASYAFRGVYFTCDVNQRLPNGKCPQEMGDEVLKLYNLDKALWVNLMALGFVALAYRLIAYAVLKAHRERWLSRLWKE
jgi:hypothetical protein